MLWLKLVLEILVVEEQHAGAMPGVFRTSVVIVASLAGVLSNVVVNAQQPHDSSTGLDTTMLTAAAAGLCPPWVGRTVGHCNTGNPTVHKGSCYDHNNKQEYVQCIPPNIWDAYKCPSNIPDKCTYPDAAPGLHKLPRVSPGANRARPKAIGVRGGGDRDVFSILVGCPYCNPAVNAEDSEEKEDEHETRWPPAS